MELDMTFIGEFTKYPVAGGGEKERLHLDGAASPLASSIAIDSINKLLPHYSNSHSYVHNSAKISTKAFDWAGDTILSCLNAHKQDYTCVFIGSGTTAASNRLARGLGKTRADKKVIMVSSMEHHANDLPHRQADNLVVHFPLEQSIEGNKDSDGQYSNLGAIDLIELEALCRKHSGNINYIAVSSVSNVTGIRNPIKDIAKIAHAHGALIVVDAAQGVAHMPSNISDGDIDFFIFSGHKVYTPMAPGVLIAKRCLLKALSGQDLGGGSVSDVSFHDYNLFQRFPDREQAGTPNIVGAAALAHVFKSLAAYGFQTIEEHALKLTKQLISGLSEITGISIYGDISLNRIGAVSFNHDNIDHGLFAAILNDYFAIAVRNECFCAHPYVSTLLKEELWSLDLDDIPDMEQEAYINRKRGMVRASVSLYTDEKDIIRLLSAINNIVNNIDQYKPHYEVNEDGSYHHKTFVIDWQSELSL